MKKLNLFVLLGIITILLISCGVNPSSQLQPTKNDPLVRPTPPENYAGMRSPTMGAVDLEEGKKIYQVNCSSCHGDQGLGDGPAAISLDPKPEPLANTVVSLGDDYLFWRISEGGIMPPFKSAMPAWKTILKEKQIWQVIHYLRSFGE